MTLTDEPKQKWGAFLDKTKLDFFLKYSGETILDAGCGRGVYTKELNKKKFAVGIDSSKTVIKDARKKYPGVKFIVANVCKLPFKDNSFDTVICSDVLEHLKDDLKGLKEMVRVCRKNIIATVPSEKIPKIFRVLGVVWYSREDHTHVRYYSYERLKKLFKLVKMDCEIRPWYPSQNIIIKFIKSILISFGIFPDFMVIGYKKRS